MFLKHRFISAVFFPFCKFKNDFFEIQFGILPQRKIICNFFGNFPPFELFKQRNMGYFVYYDGDFVVFFERVYNGLCGGEKCIMHNSKFRIALKSLHNLQRYSAAEKTYSHRNNPCVITCAGFISHIFFLFIKAAEYR